MAKFDIDYRFEKNASGKMELVVYIDNPDRDLSFSTAPIITYSVPSDEPRPANPDSLYRLTVYVEEDELGNNSETLRFVPTRYYEEGGEQKYLQIYCATKAGIETTRKKRRTNTTVSNGGGL